AKRREQEWKAIQSTKSSSKKTESSKK
ncbi:hypothetical protein GCK32_021886, partial [Trichostrongylus colubriformis]